MSPSPPSTVTSTLDAFLEAAAPGPFAYEACHHFAGRAGHERHVVFGFVIHGNEYGSLSAARRLQEKLLANPPLGPVTLLLGNVDAVRQDARFVEEDFNRVFTFDREASSLERRRAEATRPVLDAADFFLDFHQTQTPTEKSFYTFPWGAELGQWARALGAAPVGLTRRTGQAFSPGLRCLDEYVRARGKTGLTVEIGTRGVDDAQAERVYETALRTLALTDALAAGRGSLESEASKMPPLTWYQTVHIVKTPSLDARLRPGLCNWTPVGAGEELQAPGSPPIVCPVDGMTLFPKYPVNGQQPPPELVRIAACIEDPRVLDD